jgi:glucose-6-phosphate isomerase
LHSKIDDLFGGKKVNYTENLAAWHPKYRDQYNPSSFDTPSNKNQQVELSNLKDLCCNAKNIVTIGIGGSFEGPKMLVESMDLSQDDAKFIFITGSDSNEFKIKTKQLNPKDTIFLVSSKSFTTMETISMLKEALSWSGELNKFIAITANKEEAEKYKINNIIEFDKEIGGRYSIWSEISSLIHCLKKNEYDDFMAGGKQADIDLKKNTSYIKFVKALAYSDIWFHNSKNKNSRVILSYDWNLRSFTNYIQQLEMESLGKQPSIRSEFKKTGQIIFGGYGPTAQHSYFQLLHQGTQDICADIIASKKDKKSLAYAQAITQSRLMTLGDEVFNDHEKINADIPINLFLINNTSSYELGYLLATWEHRTYITAVMLGINPFDQFGVIASKIYTKKYLSDKD